jgi:Asp-tRNA(Asn)/Glu-tRNA(Gln) amidotransferase A subunit family amidase
MIGVQTARSQLAGLVQIPTGCDSFDHMVEKVIRSTGLPARVADVDLAAAWRLGGTVMGFEALQANGFLLSERHRLDPFVRKRLIAAQEISAREYLNALRYRGIARKDVSSMLNKNEVFVLPTLDTAVPTLEEALEVSLNRLTLPFNYLDFSVLAMPLNTDGANQASFNGIPFSIQLASPSRGVGLLLEAAEILVD